MELKTACNETTMTNNSNIKQLSQQNISNQQKQKDVRSIGVVIQQKSKKTNSRIKSPSYRPSDRAQINFLYHVYIYIFLAFQIEDTRDKKITHHF